MKNPFTKLFKTQPKPVPKKVMSALQKNFPEALNIDWEVKKEGFEAVFYLNEAEYISLFSNEGVLLEYKKNLWQNEVPEPVLRECGNLGEIMNSIAIYRGDDLFYEIIVRDLKLNRTLLLFDRDGKLILSNQI